MIIFHAWLLSFTITKQLIVNKIIKIEIEICMTITLDHSAYGSHVRIEIKSNIDILVKCTHMF